MTTEQQQQQQAWKKRDTNNGSVSLLTNQKSSQFATADINSKPYVCNQCDLSFNRAHNLKSHLATHSTARPFQCTTCNNFFRRQHDLKRHQRLHTGERPYPCQNCGRSFARLDALNRHQRAEVVRKPNSLDVITNNPIISQFDSSASPPEPTHLLTTSPTGFKSMSLPPLKNHDLSSSPPPHSYRSCTYPGKIVTSLPQNLNRITLPSPDHLLLPLPEQVSCLAQENRCLKLEIKQLTIDSARMHDLEKENKFLKSLIHQQKDTHLNQNAI